jgi:hypothetical protein
LTKDLTPVDPSIKSPLRDLDWTDDDIAMEVVSGRIYDRNIDEILDAPVLLNDRGGETTYFPSMAEQGEHIIKISVPSTILHMLEQIAKEYHDTDLSDAVRVCAVHGCSIYEHKFGAEIEALYHNNFQKQLDGNKDSVRIHLLSMNIEFLSIRYSCRIESRFFQLLSKFAAHAGCSKQYMVGYWIIYSLRSHPNMKKWYSQMDEIINDVDEIMNLRVKLLK